jgi:broad specificity phosphatase PhoE
MEVTILRHGQSMANVGLTEELDSPLTPVGTEQALAAAEWFRADIERNGDFRQVYVSPFRRTLMTFAPISQATKAPAHLLAEVCEYFHDSESRYHTFEGLTRKDIERDYPFVDARPLFDTGERWWPLDLENHEAVVARARRVARYLIDKYGETDGRILIVSHAETTGRLVEALLGLRAALETPWTSNCGIWRIAIGAGGLPGRLVLENFVGHLADVTGDRGA